MKARAALPFPLAAVAWALWLWALVLAAPNLQGLLVPSTAGVAALAAWWLHPVAREASRTGTLLVASVLAAVWMLIGLVLQRPMAGGQVVWVLPEFAPASGAVLGGPVTTGQLLWAAQNALTAAALSLCAALALVAVGTQQWHSFFRLLMGRGGDVFLPALLLVEERAVEADAVDGRRSHGLPAVGGDWRAPWARALARARAWSAVTSGLPRASCGWLRLPVAVLALGAATVIAVREGGALGPLAVGAVLGVLLVLGALLWRGSAPHSVSAAIPPATSAVALIGLWQSGLISEPLWFAAALALLPAATLFIWEKR